MARIFAFAGSNSPKSINRQLVLHTVSQFEEYPVRELDLSHLDLPFYSVDLETASGVPATVSTFLGEIGQADGLVVSVNEYNGNPSAFFKNLLDWASRSDRRFLAGRMVLLMSTSPGGGGGANALGVVERMFGHFGATVAATFSLPRFGEHFREGEGILDSELRTAHRTAMDTFIERLQS